VEISAYWPLPKLPRFQDSLAFLNNEEAVGQQVLETLFPARRPGNLDIVDLERAAQAEVKSKVIL
jgi:hypothetical protein